MTRPLHVQNPLGPKSVTTACGTARVSAVAGLGRADGPAAAETLLQLCAMHGEPKTLLRSAGRELARVSFNDGIKITQFDMRDMSAEAFDEFCEFNGEPPTPEGS